MTVPIAEQIAEVEREIRQRERLYPKWIIAKRLKQETADTKLRDLRAAAATLRVVAAHADGLRLLVQYLRAAKPHAGEMPGETETEMLLAQPAVRAVLDAFPDATLVSIEPIAPMLMPEDVPQPDELVAVE